MVELRAETAESVALLRRFQAQLQFKRAALVDVAVDEPRTQKLLARLDLLLALTDEMYRGLLN